MKTAIIDVGSNSVRIMLEKNGELHRKEIVTTQLALGLEKTGRLSAETMARTLFAMMKMTEQAKKSGFSQVTAFATEAVRRAENGREFVECVRDQLDLNLDVIDGKTEATCGFAGAKNGIDGRAAVLDIGGASVELSVGDREIEYTRSEPIGAVRLKERYPDRRGRIETELEQLLSPFRDAPPFERLIAIGGTPTSLVSILDNFTVYDPSLVHGKTLEIEQVEEVCRYLNRTTEKRLVIDYPLIDEKRAEVLPFGAAVLLGVMRATGKKAVTVSEKDNLEGYAMWRRIETD